MDNVNNVDNVNTGKKWIVKIPAKKGFLPVAHEADASPLVALEQIFSLGGMTWNRPLLTSRVAVLPDGFELCLYCQEGKGREEVNTLASKMIPVDDSTALTVHGDAILAGSIEPPFVGIPGNLISRVMEELSAAFDYYCMGRDVHAKQA